jgi:DUF917 family protein
VIGRAVRVERRLLGGFARGVLQLAGTGADRGRSLRIEFQNENLIARSGTDEILAVVPDLICLVDEDSRNPSPLRSCAMAYGVVLGIPALQMLKTFKALEVIGPAAFGYADVRTFRFLERTDVAVEERSIWPVERCTDVMVKLSDRVHLANPTPLVRLHPNGRSVYVRR